MMGVVVLLAFAALVIWLIWRGKKRVALLLVAAAFGFLGFVVFVALRTNSHVASHAAAIKKLSPEVTDWSKVDKEYWNWEGDFDWFRTPVRYPYDLHSIDTPSAHGFLNRNIHSGHSSEPTHDGQTKINDIEAYSTDSHFFVFHQIPRDGTPEKWGIFAYLVDTTDYFKDEASMWAEAIRRGYAGPTTLESIESHYTNYWH